LRTTASTKASIVRQQASRLAGHEGHARTGGSSDAAPSVTGPIFAAQLPHLALQRGQAVGAALAVYSLSVETFVYCSSRVRGPGSCRSTTYSASPPWRARLAAGAVAGLAAGVASSSDAAATGAPPLLPSLPQPPFAAVRGQGSPALGLGLKRLRGFVARCGLALAANAACWSVAVGACGASCPALEQTRVGMANAAERRHLRSTLNDLEPASIFISAQ
jgi:hypothetical protein